MKFHIFIWEDCFQLRIDNELVGEMGDWKEVIEFLDEHCVRIDVTYIPAWYY